MAELPITLPGESVAGTFDQAIDHGEDGAALGTFKQRYWYSKGFATSATSPVLFVVCAEHRCNPSQLKLLGDSARVLGASVVTLEHRYYGDSRIFPEPTLDQMKYLTVHNAVEDLAAFARFATTSLGLGGKWIVVGGSYGGQLAAFLRTTHPELVVGAWASSAPIYFQSFYSEYDAVASRTVGPTCTLLVQRAIAQARTLAESAEGAAFLGHTLFDDDAHRSTAELLEELTDGRVNTAVQYGRWAPLCSALVAHADDPLGGLLAALDPPLTPDPLDPLEAGPPPATWPPGSLRAHTFFYQQCTDVGGINLKNPDRTQSLMPDELDEDYYAEKCWRLFQKKIDTTKTQAEYAAPIFAGKVDHLLFVNGTDDPWSHQSFVDPSAAPSGVTVFRINAGSHCTDLANLTPGLALGVFEAHALFARLAKEWLAEGPG